MRGLLKEIDWLVLADTVEKLENLVQNKINSHSLLKVVQISVFIFHFSSKKAVNRDCIYHKKF